jgi:hypothetical protein
VHLHYWPKDPGKKENKKLDNGKGQELKRLSNPTQTLRIVRDENDELASDGDSSFF